MEDDDSSTDTGDELEEPWIEWYCRQQGNEFLCQVDRGYIGAFTSQSRCHQEAFANFTLPLMLPFSVASCFSCDTEDSFNLYGLRNQVPNYSDMLALVLDDVQTGEFTHFAHTFNVFRKLGTKPPGPKSKLRFRIQDRNRNPGPKPKPRVKTFLEFAQGQNLQLPFNKIALSQSGTCAHPSNSLGLVPKRH